MTVWIKTQTKPLYILPMNKQKQDPYANHKNTKYPPLLVNK